MVCDKAHGYEWYLSAPERNGRKNRKCCYFYLITDEGTTFKKNKALLKLAGEGGESTLQALDNLPKLELEYRTEEIEWTHKYDWEAETKELKCTFRLPYLTPKQEWAKIPEGKLFLPVRPNKFEWMVGGKHEKFPKAKKEAQDRLNEEKKQTGDVKDAAEEGAVGWDKLCPHIRK